MNYLSVENLSKSYGEKVLFESITFGLSKGDKVALIANNGFGKSTLLRILVGDDHADSGVVSQKNGIRISILSQEPYFDSDYTVNEIIKSTGTAIQEIISEYNNAVELNSRINSKESQKNLEEAINKMDVSDAWDMDRRVKLLLDKFNITNLDQKISTMSGGQIKRLSLALTLLDSPDILLLDEPTNHLDISMIEWLEKHLSSTDITLLMVTHDRYFLDRICDNILELSDGNIYSHKGNYSYFLEKKAEREDNQKTEIDKAKKLMKKELEWIRRMPKARTTKSKARIDSFNKTKDKATSAVKDEELKLGVQMSRVGGKILEMEQVSKRFGDNVILEKFDYVFKKGERIGFVGENGVGKTTFLNLVLKEIKPDSGNINTGDTIVYGYYKQEGIKINKNQTVLQVVKDIAEIIPMGKDGSLTASQFLNHFLFPPKVQNDYVSKLSGGERRRLYLLTVLMKNPNFLILDEPTNDLDLITLNKLEEFLESYKGCLILVSHDRYFLDKLVDHLFVFKGNGNIKNYQGNYTQYRAYVAESEKKQKSDLSNHQSKKEIKGKSSNDSSAITTKVKTKLSFNEKREYESLISEIEILEAEKLEIEEQLNSGDLGYERISELSTRITEVINQLDEKTLRWMELDEFV